VSSAISAMAARRAARADRGAPTSAIDQQVRLLGGLLVADVTLQRLALSLAGLGQVPLVLLLGLLVAVIGLRRGLLWFDRSRVVLGLAALAAVALASMGSLLVTRRLFSVPSLIFLVANYVPLLLVVSGGTAAEVGRRVLAVLVRLATVLAVLSLLQLAVQFVGWHQPDILGSLLPPSVVQQGFNGSSPFYYGSPYFRSTGFVSLEPSLCSQVLALGVLAQLWLRRGSGPLALLLAGMLTTLAGTGFVIIAVGLVASALTRSSRVLVRLLPLASVALLVALATPLGGLLLARATEGGGRSTSTGQRFQLPFVILVPGWLSDVGHALVGSGAGASVGLIGRQVGEVAVLPLAPLKLVYEYGALGAVAFLVFLGWCLLQGCRAAPLGVGLAVSYVLLTSSLQLSVLIVLVWVVGCACPRDLGRPVRPPRARLALRTPLRLAGVSSARTVSA